MGVLVSVSGCDFAGLAPNRHLDANASLAVVQSFADSLDPQLSAQLNPSEIASGSIVGWIDGVRWNESGYSVTGWACGDGTPVSHRFTIPMEQALLSQCHGQAIYIHGISPNGQTNSLLGQSGKYLLPGISSLYALPASKEGISDFITSASDDVQAARYQMFQKIGANYHQYNYGWQVRKLGGALRLQATILFIIQVRLRDLAGTRARSRFIDCTTRVMALTWRRSMRVKRNS